MSRTVSYTVTADLDRFEFWSGAKARMDSATDQQREQVFDRVAEYCECFDEVTETAINDIVWFECDDIFFPDEEDDE